jgi:hypothetical protein
MLSQKKNRGVHGKDLSRTRKNQTFKSMMIEYRHWDLERRQIQSCFYKENKEEAIGINILKGENFDSPQKNL